VLNGYSGWKWGATWDEGNLGQAADIDFTVRDATTNAVLATQQDYPIHNRLRLDATQIAGRKLKACTYGFSVPAGGRTVYMADFVHSYPGD
jgi:hypothetical protein